MGELKGKKINKYWIIGTSIMTVVLMILGGLYQVGGDISEMDKETSLNKQKIEMIENRIIELKNKNSCY